MVAAFGVNLTEKIALYCILLWRAVIMTIRIKRCLRPFLAGNVQSRTVDPSESIESIAMACWKTKVVFFLLLLSVFPPFFLERSKQSASVCLEERPVKTSSSHQLEHSERVQRVSKLLLTPTFPIHLFWIVGLCVTFLASVFDMFLKLTFVCCATAITTLSPKPLPLLR